MRWALCLLAALALCAAPGALASEDDPTSFEVQNELYCTDCDTTLADASAVSYTPAAINYIEQLIADGEKKSEIKERLAERYLGHLLVMPSKTVGERPTLADLEDEVMCPACNTTLDQSSSPPRAGSRLSSCGGSRPATRRSRSRTGSSPTTGLDPRRAAEGGLRPARVAPPARGPRRRGAACSLRSPGTGAVDAGRRPVRPR